MPVTTHTPVPVLVPVPVPAPAPVAHGVIGSNIPNVKDKKNIPVVPTGRPKVEDYKGRFKRKDGEVYALAVIPEGGEYGRTHFALNSLHEWSGTEPEFRAEFEKE